MAMMPLRRPWIVESVDGDARTVIGEARYALEHLIFTHGHPDHIGSAAAIVRETGARTYMHPLDIPMAESGGPFRPMRPAPGLLRQASPSIRTNPVSEATGGRREVPLTKWI